MAKMKTFVNADFSELETISEDEKWSILQPAAEITRAAISEAARSQFQVHTGALAASPAVVRKKKNGELVAVVRLEGKHPGSSTGVRMKLGKDGSRREAGHYSGSNAEVGYFLNYGTPRIKATHWYEYAEERAAAATQQKIEDGWNELLDKRGL